MAGDEPEKGDKVSWNWGGGAPGGKVAEKKTEGEIAITSKRGNKIKKNAEPSNPAVHIERSGNDVVKKASELNIEKKASGGNSSGEKRKHEEADEAKDGEKEPLVQNDQGKDVKPGGKDSNKKPKKEKEDKKEESKENAKETNGDDSKGKRGRPKKGEGNTGSKKKKESKPRNTEGVSGRTRSQNK